MKSTIIFFVAGILIITGCSSYFGDASNSEIIPPTIKELPMLIYPKTAQQNNYTGKSLVQILVSKDGSALETKLFQSSGYSVLDKAAIQYCQNIIFNPATVNREPVNSKTIFTINFDLSDQKSVERTYVSDIDNLLDELSEVSVSEKSRIEREILFKHKEFLGNVPEGSNPSSAVMKVISNDLAEAWEPYVNLCSLTFLIYHDFLKRFPDYTDITNVKYELQKAASNDLKMLENTPDNNFKNPKVKDKISLLIRNFINTKYPDLNIDNFMNQTINS